MNSLDEKNNEILANALLHQAEINNKDFIDNIDDDVSLKVIKKIAEIEMSKIESNNSFRISSLGITAAFVGIGISEIILGVTLYPLPEKKMLYYSQYYIWLGFIIIILGIAFYGLAKWRYDKIREELDFFHQIILKIERRLP